MTIDETKARERLKYLLRLDDAQLNDVLRWARYEKAEQFYKDLLARLFS
jgi:hypothetical protein